MNFESTSKARVWRDARILLSVAGLVAACSGSDGAAGPAGEPGGDGERGATGPAGEAGPKGANGSTGATGPEGDQGEQGPEGDPATSPDPKLAVLGTYQSKQFDVGAAEIVAYHAGSKRLFVVNAKAGTLDTLDVTAPATPTKVTNAAFAFNVAVDVATKIPGFVSGGVNSVSVSGDTIALAVQAEPKTNNGAVAFYNAATGAFLNAVSVGALPDMLTYTPDGKKVLVANEGEPAEDYSADPEGSVSVIDVSAGVTAAQAPPVVSVGFTAFNNRKDKLLAMGAHFTLFGADPSVAKDIEPEYITVSSDSKKAWVTCQEANLIAVVDLAAATPSVTELLPLGFKDYRVTGNGFDPSDRDGVAAGGGNVGRIGIGNFPVYGMYQPDAIASYVVDGVTYLVTANEGDVREWKGANSEIARVSSLTLDSSLPASLKDDAVLGRLNVTTRRGMTAGGAYKELYSFGARSFSIWTTTGSLVYDSGNEFELVTAAAYPANFNASNTSHTLDNRSDDKGPEPEGVVVGEVDGRFYAFVGLERIGGVMVYDVTNPRESRFVQYLNNRDFSVSAVEDSVKGDGAVKDLGPEGLLFIPAAQSPNNTAMLVVGNEISGTTTLYRFAKP